MRRMEIKGEFRTKYIYRNTYYFALSAKCLHVVCPSFINLFSLSAFFRNLYWMVLKEGSFKYALFFENNINYVFNFKLKKTYKELIYKEAHFI